MSLTTATGAKQDSLEKTKGWQTFIHHPSELLLPDP
jgi:hypothetical protein